MELLCNLAIFWIAVSAILAIVFGGIAAYAENDPTARLRADTFDLDQAVIVCLFWPVAALCIAGYWIVHHHFELAVRSKRKPGK